MQGLLDYLYEGFYSGRILAGSFIFAHFLLQKRPKVNALLSWIVCIAVTAVTAGFNPLIASLVGTVAMQHMMLIHLFWYSGLLFVLFGVLVANYKGSFFSYAFTFTCGLLVECSAFGLFRLFYDAGVFELRVNTPLSLLSELLFSAALYAVYYFIFRRVYRDAGIADLHGRRGLTFALLLIIALTMFMRFNLQDVYETLHASASSGWIVSLTLGIIPIAFLTLVTFVVQMDRLRGEKQVLAGMLSERERQYSLSARNIEIINRKCHDIKRHLRALRFTNEADRENTLREIEQSVNIYDASIATGNPALDTILSEKRLECGARGIRLTCSAGQDALAFMTPSDVYVMVGNILDNAIEAVSQIEDEEKRVITLTCTAFGGVQTIREDNYFAGEVTFQDGMPATTKREDPGFHGYGVRSIRHIAEKYGGILQLRAEEGVFSLLVTLPCAGTQKTE